MDKNIIRDLVKKHLSEKPRNTIEIKDWLSDKIYLEDNCDIADILESEPTIIRIGRIMKSGVIGKESPLSEWATDEWVSHHERNSLETMEINKMRTTRLRQKIKKFLDNKGEANTTEILEHVNPTMRHGTTPQQLGNVLSKDKDIMKIATTKRGGALSGRYEICVWQLRPGAQDRQE